VHLALSLTHTLLPNMPVSLEARASLAIRCGVSRGMKYSVKGSRKTPTRSPSLSRWLLLMLGEAKMWSLEHRLCVCLWFWLTAN
jgi:hypothetical protein